MAEVYKYDASTREGEGRFFDTEISLEVIW
jgi:hypothetical protein